MYSFTGWHDGAMECHPPEPGKQWLTIWRDGEELAVIVHRGELTPTIRAAKERDAGAICDALERLGY